jgi:hypothetical protein
MSVSAACRNIPFLTEGNTENKGYSVRSRSSDRKSSLPFVFLWFEKVPTFRRNLALVSVLYIGERPEMIFSQRELKEGQKQNGGKHAPWCVGDGSRPATGRWLQHFSNRSGSGEKSLCPLCCLLLAEKYHRARKTVHRAVATAAAVLLNSIQTESSLSSFPSV